MKILITILTLALVVSIQADEAQKIHKAYAERDAEIRKEIKLIEFQLFELTARVSALNKRLGSNKPDPSPQENLLIDVLGPGKYAVGTDKLTPESLRTKLRAITAVKKDLRVRIRGNGKVEYGAIVKLIDLLQKADVYNISFATQVPRK